MAKAVKKVVKRRRERKVVEKGAVHIRSSFNNTMVTLFRSPLLYCLLNPACP